MKALSLDKMQEQFPEFAHTLETGEEIVLEKSGEPIAKIVPIKKGKPILEKEQDKVWGSGNFTDPLYLSIY